MNRTIASAAVAVTLVALATTGCGDKTTQASSAAPAAPTSTSQPASAPAASQGATEPTGSATSGTVTVTATATVTATPTTTPTTVPTASSAATTTAPAQGTSTMRHLGVQITSASQVDSKLAGTSEGFQAYLADKFAELSKGCTSGTYPSVANYWKDDQAMGSFTACGGAETIWFLNHNHAWSEFGFQAVPSCAEVRKAGVPHAIPASTGFRCTNSSGTAVAYSPVG